MFKYYVFITLLFIFISSLVFLTINITGSPSTVRGQQIDTLRINDFTQIRSQIDQFAYSNKRIPLTLDELKSVNPQLNINDPETKQLYGYKIDSNIKYSLCTTFSEIDKVREIRTLGFTHKKGYDCIVLPFSFPYTQTNLPSPTLTPSPIPIPTVIITPSLNIQSTYACSQKYLGTCQPTCTTNQINVGNNDAVNDCAINSKGNPLCCAPK